MIIPITREKVLQKSLSETKADTLWLQLLSSLMALPVAHDVQLFGPGPLHVSHDSWQLIAVTATTGQSVQAPEIKHFPIEQLVQLVDVSLHVAHDVLQVLYIDAKSVYWLIKHLRQVYW